MGWFARRGVSRVVTRLFIRLYGVNLSEATGELTDYPNLEALFVRELKPGSRPIEADPAAMASPVDGTVAWVGRTTNGRIPIAGKRAVTLHNLVGEPADGERDAIVIYLSPKDYHRVHVPREGHATRWRYVPGTLWPVFPAAVARVDELFARNERMVVHIETDHGPLDVVLVGAFGVGRISLSICELLSNAGAAAHEAELSPPAELRRGEELGVFHLGSTVVLSAPLGRWNWSVKAGQSVRMGSKIATELRALEQRDA